MDVAADEAGGQGFQMLVVVDEAQGVFAGGMTEIVPIACGFWKAGQNSGPGGIDGNFFDGFAAFQSELHLSFGGVSDQVVKDFFDPGPLGLEPVFMINDGLDLEFDVVA